MYDWSTVFILFPKHFVVFDAIEYDKMRRNSCTALVPEKKEESIAIAYNQIRFDLYLSKGDSDVLG